MKKYGKIAALLSAVVISVGAMGTLAACTPDDKTPDSGSSEAAPTVAQVTGDVSFWGPKDDQKTFETLWAKFKALYPNAGKLNYTVKESGDVATDITGDPIIAADMYIYASDQFNRLMLGKALAPVPNYIVYGDEDAETRVKDSDGNFIYEGMLNRDTASSYEPVYYTGRYFSLPLQDDNGYVLAYDKSFFSEEDVKTLDGIIAKCVAATDNTAGTRFFWDYGNGYYAAIPFFSMGLEAKDELSGSLTGDGILKTTFTCNYNNADGVKAGKAIIPYFTGDNKGKIVSGSDSDVFLTGMRNGSIKAGIVGTWRTEVNGTAAGDWGENGAWAKLPTFTVEGKQVQMGSFVGPKYVGVNSYSKNRTTAFCFANYITSEIGQKEHYNDRKSGPSNKKVAELPEVKANAALAAYNAQKEAAGVAQVAVPSGFWDATGAFIPDIVNGTITAENMQAKLDDLVSKMSGVVTE